MTADEARTKLKEQMDTIRELERNKVCDALEFNAYELKIIDGTFYIKLNDIMDEINKQRKLYTK